MVSPLNRRRFFDIWHGTTISTRSKTYREYRNEPYSMPFGEQKPSDRNVLCSISPVKSPEHSPYRCGSNFKGEPGPTCVKSRALTVLTLGSGGGWVVPSGALRCELESELPKGLKCISSRLYQTLGKPELRHEHGVWTQQYFIDQSERTRGGAIGPYRILDYVIAISCWIFFDCVSRPLTTDRSVRECVFLSWDRAIAASARIESIASRARRIASGFGADSAYWALPFLPAARSALNFSMLFSTFLSTRVLSSFR